MRLHKKVMIMALVSLALAFVAIAFASPATFVPQCEHPARLKKARGKKSDRLDNEYMITLHNDYHLIQHLEYLRKSSPTIPQSGCHIITSSAYVLRRSLRVELRQVI